MFDYAHPHPPWQSKTPCNHFELGSQSKLINDKLGSSPSSLKEGFNQLVKGSFLMAHQMVLWCDRITELEAANEASTRRKSRKRKRLQQGGTVTFEAESQLAAEKGCYYNV